MLDPKVVERAEVSGRAIRAIVAAFGNFTMLASQYLLAEGIGEPQPDGSVKLDDDRYYPMRAWIRVLRNVEAEFGPRLLRQAGELVVRGAKGPSGVVDVRSALAAQNLIYHSSHRLDGRPMLDPASLEVIEGIGSFEVRFPEHQNLAFVTVDTPAPCPMNAGSAIAIAHAFEPHAELFHEPGPCRSKGGDHCTYRVTWPAG